MTFICAEIGVNWRTLNEADEMIREAAAAGADGCKFQAYTWKEIKEETDGPLHKIILNETAVRYLYWRCRAVGVEFLCTPMYPAAVDMLNPYVKRWKIRYKDRENKAILDKCQLTGKPMLISGKNVYCVPEYPPALKGVCGKGIFKGYNGVSSHYPCIPFIAAVFESSPVDYVEVHVKRDHYPDNYCPIDNAVSITMSELKQLCMRIKG